MRILHILASPHPGGAERMCIAIANAVSNAKHEVLLHAFHDGNSVQEAKRMGLNVTVQPPPPRPAKSRGEQWQRFGIGLHATVREFQPQIIHSHVPLSHLICHRIHHELRVPWVATVHGSWRQFGYAPQTASKPYLRPFLLLRHALGDRIALRSAARIAAVSEYVAGELHSVGLPHERIVRIYNGLDVQESSLSKSEARARLYLEVDQFAIGAMGYYSPVKGFDILIRGFARVHAKFPAARLIIAGGSVMGEIRMKSSLESLARKLEVSEQVRLLEQIDLTSDFFRALDLFVMSSRTEGMPLVLLEAMRHGLASVVTSAGGCAELARDGLEGLVYTSPNSEDLARKLEALMTNATMRTGMGKSALSRSSEFGMERCRSEYLQMYESVLQARPT